MDGIKSEFRVGGVFVALGLCAISTAAQMDWSSVGGDSANSRYSTLSKINTLNIKNLGAAWTVTLNSAGTSSAIVVADGRLFVTAGAAVYALDPVNGHVLWSRETPAPPSQKGIATGGGRVFVGLANAELIALDEKTGAPLWNVQIGDAARRGVALGRPPPSRLAKALPKMDLTGGQHISAAPAYVDGKVIVGLANGDFGVRGRIVAVEGTTGRRLWQFFTIPDPTGPGHQTWPSGSNVWKTGGGGVWMNPAVDSALGLVYLGVGNPVPQLGGEIRPGDNLFTDSVVALDIQTGKLAWYFQGVHHDIWDHDFGTPLVLFDATLQGQKVFGLAAMRADGYLFELDRRTGKPLLSVIEKPVAYDTRMRMSPTQPFPVGTDPIGPRCVEKETAPPGFVRKCFFDVMGYEPNLLFPFTATRAAPMSFSAQTGYFYVTSSVRPEWMRRGDDPYYYGFRGAPGIKSHGLITALDARTGKIAWQRRVAHPAAAGSGASSTAGGLVWHGDPDGELQAYDARSGRSLWAFQTGAPVDGPVSTYEAHGEQFVVVGAHDLWAFKLGGTLSPRPAPPVTGSETTISGPIARTDTIKIGTDLFDVANTGPHVLFDEYALQPTRVHVAQGATVRWFNASKLTHTLLSQGGAWNTGPIQPGHSKSLVMSKPGRYFYTCLEHPWSMGELIVGNVRTDSQVSRGEKLYRAHCAVCHREDLGGKEPAPALAGDDFAAQWHGRPQNKLFQLVRAAMPLGRPNSLSSQEYLDIVWFLLDANDLPSDGTLP